MRDRTNLKSLRSILAVLVGLGLCATAKGRTIHVDNDGPADFNNIQAAIDDSNDGDTVLVADGTYTGDGNRDIDFLGKAITVRSENGPEACIIDCNGSETEPHRGFYFHSGEDAGSVVKGFTIENGFAEYGSGVYCHNSSNPTISQCTIMSGRAYGGSICCNDSSPTITDCLISGNEAAGGGGICCVEFSAPTIKNCIIVNNSVVSFGGGIYCANSWPEITNCVINNNVASEVGPISAEGGGIMCELSGPAIRNCVISNNSASRGGAASFYSSDPVMANCTVSYNSADDCGGVSCFRSNPTIENCILWDNLPDQLRNTTFVRYSNVQGGWSGEGNVDVDPCFAEPGYWDPNGTPEEPNDDFWVDGDFHLKSQAGRWDPNSQSWVQDDVTSPCIDAGNPLSPIGYEPFPNGGIINMGAYGGTVEASKSYFGEPLCETIVAGDINGDCKVDFEDLTLMAIRWLHDQNL